MRIKRGFFGREIEGSLQELNDFEEEQKKRENEHMQYKKDNAPTCDICNTKKIYWQDEGVLGLDTSKYLCPNGPHTIKRLRKFLKL